MWSALIPVWNWFSGIGTFFKENKWAQWVAAGIIGLIVFKRYESEQAKKYTEIGRKQAEEQFKKSIKEANHETVQRIENANTEARKIEEKLYDRPSGSSPRTSDDLNRQQLQQLAANDPHNAGRRVRHEDD